MISREYRDIIAKLAYNIIKRQFPGLKKPELQAACREIAVNIHARMYGANVDSVDSPIWRDRQCSDRSQFCPRLPLIDAMELLREGEQ